MKQNDTFNIDGFIVDIAACDDLDLAKYHNRITRYLHSISEMRVKSLEVVGYGAFINDRFMKVFDTVELAHQYCVRKIINIYECELNEVGWEHHEGIGRIKHYWIGDKNPYSDKRIAHIATVDIDNDTVWHFSLNESMPDYIDQKNKSLDTKEKALSSLVQKNIQLQKRNLELKRALSYSYQDIEKIMYLGLACFQLRNEIQRWLKDNSDFSDFFENIPEDSNNE
jgi:hypothetical protein